VSHAQMRENIIKQFGDDIYEKIDHYYSLENTGEARMFMTLNPEVEQAQDAQKAYVANSPLLMKYYGGIDTLDRYYTNQVYDMLEKEFGKEMVVKEQTFFDLQRDEALGLEPKGLLTLAQSCRTDQSQNSAPTSHQNKRRCLQPRSR
jgi:hypothetical protein